MAVGARQDFRLRPVGAQRPRQTAQKGADFLAFRAFGRTKNRRDEAALAVEGDNRLKAIFIVMGMNRRSATRSRCSTSRSARMPPSDDSEPPSNLTTTDLSATGDRPDRDGVKSFTADVVSQEMARMGLDNRILRQFMRLSFIRQPAVHISG
jgi:hypothetical protein